MAIDRSKYKPAPKSAMKKLDSDLGQRKGYSESYDRAGYHTIDQGDNKFRIYPAHSSSKDLNFWQAKSVGWFMIEVEKYDKDNKKTGETEVKKKPVFTSDVHGPPELSGQDLTKIYIKHAKKIFEEIFETEAERKTASDLMYKFPNGFYPKLTWVMYADKYDEKGQKITALLEISNGVKKKINELVSEMDNGDDPLSADPFTHPDDGIAIIITRTGQNLQTEYKVDFEMNRKGRTSFELVVTPLSDADLDNFEKFEPLEKMLKNSFRRRDFEMLKEGLLRFDMEHQFNVFEDEEFLTEMEEFQDFVHSVIPEDSAYTEDDSDEEQEQEPEQPKKPVGKYSKPVPKKEEPEDSYEEEPEEENEATDELPFVPDKTFKRQIANEMKKEDNNSKTSIEDIKARLANMKKK